MNLSDAASQTSYHIDIKDKQGWPVLFWSDNPWAHEGFSERLGQPWGEAWLVHGGRRHQEDAAYMVYLELRPQIEGGAEPIDNYRIDKD